MKIAIIGTGNLGHAIASGIEAKIPFDQMILTRRNSASLQYWNQVSDVHVSQDNRWAAQESDLIVLAIQPGQLEGIANEIKEVLTPDKVLISVVTVW